MNAITLQVFRSKIITYLRILFIGFACLNFTFTFFESDISLRIIYLIQTIFCFYLYWECKRYILLSDQFGLLAAPFLASLAFFFLSFVLPVTVAFLYPSIIFNFIDTYPNYPDLISRALLMAMACCFLMWRGFYFAEKRASAIYFYLLRRQGIRRYWAPNLRYLYGIEFANILITAFSIRQGIFGLLASNENRLANAEFIEYVHLLNSAATLSLFLILICYFHLRNIGIKNISLKFWCIFFFIAHVLIALISGFKSQLVLPFILLAFANFIATKNISKTLIGLILGSLFLSYLIVEPYRELIGSYDLVGAKPSVSQLVEGVITAPEEFKDRLKPDMPTYAEIVNRFDLTQMTAVGFYAVDQELIPKEAGGILLGSIYLSPFLAYLPRFIWSSKPSFNTGGLFNQFISGNYSDTTTSIGLGPIALFYMIGSELGVILGFFAIGYLQSLTFNGFARLGAGGLLMYLGILELFVIIPTEVGPTLVQLFRLLPLLYIMQRILLRPKHF